MQLRASAPALEKNSPYEDTLDVRVVAGDQARWDILAGEDLSHLFHIFEMAAYMKLQSCSYSIVSIQ